MKKLFFIVLAAIVFAPVCSMAADINWGQSGWCAVDNHGNPHWFWYCGTQSTGCAGKSDGSKDRNVFLTDATHQTTASVVSGDPDNYQDYKHWAFYYRAIYVACCGGNKSTPGKLVTYNGTWLAKTTKEVGGGTCTYYTNPCGTKFNENGDETDGTCTVPDSCPEGQLLGEISGQTRCICPNGEGFDGSYSSGCVSCATTPTQGVDKNGACIKCTASNEFFKSDGDCTGTECCRKKSETPLISKTAIARCWRCPLDRELWKECVENEVIPQRCK